MNYKLHVPFVVNLIAGDADPAGGLELRDEAQAGRERGARRRPGGRAHQPAEGPGKEPAPKGCKERERDVVVMIFYVQVPSFV